MLNIDPEKLLELPGKVTVYWMDKSQQLLGCNNYMAELFFCQPADVIGRNPFEFDSVSEEEAGVFCAANKVVLENRTPAQLYETYTYLSFSRKFSTLKMPLLGSNNKLIGVVGISHLVSENFPDKKNIIKTQLSSQEIACINLLVLGRTAKEIAKTLSLSYRTVEHYLDNAKMKMNVCNRIQLVQKFLDERTDTV